MHQDIRTIRFRVDREGETCKHTVDTVYNDGSEAHFENGAALSALVTFAIVHGDEQIGPLVPFLANVVAAMGDAAPASLRVLAVGGADDESVAVYLSRRGAHLEASEDDDAVLILPGFPVGEYAEPLRGRLQSGDQITGSDAMFEFLDAIEPDVDPHAGNVAQPATDGSGEAAASETPGA